MRNKELDFAFSKGGGKHRQVMICSLKWRERVFRRERRKLTINGLDGREFQIRSLSERFGLRSVSAMPLSPLFIPIFTHYPFGDCPEALFSSKCPVVKFSRNRAVGRALAKARSNTRRWRAAAGILLVFSGTPSRCKATSLVFLDEPSSGS